jgi:hypothetical protein
MNLNHYRPKTNNTLKFVPAKKTASTGLPSAAL